MADEATTIQKTAKRGDSPEAGKPYHHGHLSRALVAAGRRILETEGPDALSLRAVAREAGVSPAAPYHHFKDKDELLDAVSAEGWRELGDAIARARAEAASAAVAVTEIGVAYIRFARENPALYRIMYRMACDRKTMPEHAKTAEGGVGEVAEAILASGANPASALDLQLIQIAAWCTAHGIAEMVGFKEFEDLKEELGGEEAFVRAVLAQVGKLSGAAQAMLRAAS